MINRRAFYSGLGILGVGAAVISLNARIALADADHDSVIGDDGAKTPVWRLPSEISLDLPGAIAAGGANPDVILTEFFDYNCAWCKKSAPDLERFVANDKDFSLHIIQMPILSLGSVQAAKVVLATQAIAGNAKAFALHNALLAMRGNVAGVEALEEASRQKLDRQAIETRADSDETRAKLKKHMRAGSSLGMEATPSFAINGRGIGGWPGARAIAGVIKSVRACDQLTC